MTRYHDPSAVAPVLEVAALLESVGLICSADRVGTFADAVDALGSPTVESLRHAGRSTLCSSAREQQLFDDVFSRLHPADLTVELEGNNPPLLAGDVQAGASALPPSEESAPPIPAAAARLERLESMDFSSVGEDLAPRLAGLIRRMTANRCRGRAAHDTTRASEVDISATVRALVKHNGDIGALTTMQDANRHDSVDLAVDLSGSMSAYSTALLQFAASFAATYRGHVRVCGFGTTFRELIGVGGVDAARKRLMSADRGGTDLGRSLGQLARWRRSSGRSCRPVLVVFSDGWDAGDPRMLEDALDAIRRLYRTIIWANPHVAKSGYEPRQRGIVAAMPRIDHFVSGHSVDALAEILTLVESR